LISSDIGTGRLRDWGRGVITFAVLLGATVVSTACTQFEQAMASIPVFSFMRNAPSFDPYEAPRPAPYGSVAFSTPAGESLGPLESTEAALNEFAGRIRNPLLPNDTLALRAGKVMFERNCAVCHGATGKGNGTIIGPGKFPFAQDLTAAATVGRADGYIYAVIRAGRGLMPAYGPRMNHLERWATVMYVRQLQGATGANTAPAPAAPQPTQTGQ
jgi:mono/diheme cytochrome c family protein